MYLYHNLWITNLLFLLVNRQHDTTLYYYTDRLSYIFTKDMRLETHGHTTIKICKINVWDFNLTKYYIHSCFMKLETGIGSLISIYTYINSLREVWHHHIICTHGHLLVDPHATCDGSFSNRTYITIILFWAPVDI